jgi:diguanylate cyclase (GGDEF)-like protein
MMECGKILIVSSDAAIANILHRVSARYGDVMSFNHLTSAFDYIFNEIPSLLILDLSVNLDITDTLRTLKEDPLFAGLPVLAILDERMQAPDWTKVIVDDYIWKAEIERDIVCKVQLCLLRSQRMVEVNPLTRLPGNISINREIQNRLDRNIPFALAYFDLNHFKPFNDRYGFSRGDDVIRMTGRLLLNVVKNKQPQNSFVGHIGGDDFVCITDPPLIEETCREMIAAFERLIPTIYDPEDREAGFIQSRDREGRIRSYPIIGVSIGIARTDNGVFSHYGELTELASEMRQFAKQHQGSCYRINQRSHPFS